MGDGILVLNAGSSSLKFSVFRADGGEPALEAHGQVDAIGAAPHFAVRDAAGRVRAEHAWPEGTALGHPGALDHVLGWLRAELGGLRVAGVGHRVVHGGLAHARPLRMDAAALAELERLVPLAPLHQPHNLAPIARLLAQAPELPQVACFDTAFHRSIPEIEQRFALPAELHDAGIRRYGFHGLSYESIARALPAIDPRAAAGRCIVLHLGNGASLCALRAGRSVATTMGFTTLDGLPMGTRSGALDPGVLLYLLDERGMDARAIETLLYTQSGLLGVSGLSSDMRVLLASDAPRARLAIDLYCHRIRHEIGALAAMLGGLDALVFTAGIGENAAAIRERVCLDAAWLGVALDAGANRAGGPRVSAPDSAVSAWVIPTDEEGMIARHTMASIAER